MEHQVIGLEGQRETAIRVSLLQFYYFYGVQAFSFIFFCSFITCYISVFILLLYCACCCDTLPYLVLMLEPLQMKQDDFKCDDLGIKLL